MVHNDNQKRKKADVEELDTTEIMNIIMTSGILNWNSEDAVAAPQRLEESVNRNHNIQPWATDVGHDRSITHPKEAQTRRPRGRPARKAITKSESLLMVASGSIHI
jgi:hypothetical protein